VLAITGMQFNDVTGTFQQQDVELDKLFIDVACYNNRVMSGAHMASVADLAIRSAIEKRSVPTSPFRSMFSSNRLRPRNRSATSPTTLRQSAPSRVMWRPWTIFRRQQRF
jgi:thiamine pyrophosphate-dependent acetolactate synthase large subunit-like protein